MIDRVDDRLLAWVERVVAAAGVEPAMFSLAPPNGAASGRGVSLYLLELADAPPLRGVKRAPVQLSLHYLVTTWADDPKEAHRLLGELVFAALEDPELEVRFDPVPGATWAALGALPRPAFVLRVPLRKERPEPEVERVRRPLQVEVKPLVNVQGIVLGPEDVPLGDAQVGLPSVELFARTDVNGRFRFTTVLKEPGPQVLSVRAKGWELDVPVTLPLNEDEPLVIRFNPLSRKGE